MAILGTHIKQPAEVMDYDIDYTDYLPTGDSISVQGDGITPQSAAVVVTSTTETVPTLQVGVTAVIGSGKILKVWLFGGTNGVVYKVTARITTNGGRVKEVEFKIRVKDA